MKFSQVTLFALLAAANAGIIQVNPEDITAYNYLEKIGVPLAEKIREAEHSNLRITGGTPAATGEIPYQAALLAQVSFGVGVCGGSLISSTRVVTAAHCWFDGVSQTSSFDVVLGSNSLFFGGTRIFTDQVVMHPNWTPSFIRNDVAVIRISQVSFTNLIQPVALPSGTQLNENFVGEIAVASGFGLTSDDSGIPANQVLSRVDLPVISNAVCTLAYPNHVQDSNICTSGADGRNTCASDSGGPLTVQRNGRSLLIGITSFGSGLGCQAGFPAAFARVTSFITFINQNL